MLQHAAVILVLHSTTDAIRIFFKIYVFHYLMFYETNISNILLTDAFQNLRPVYISCKYFKFEKKFHFPSFSGVIFKGLIDKLGALSILHTSP